MPGFGDSGKGHRVIGGLVGFAAVLEAGREGASAPGFVVEDEVGYDREAATRSVGPGRTHR